MNARTGLLMAALLVCAGACNSNDDTDGGTITVDVPRPDVQRPDAAPDDVTASDVATDAAVDAGATGDATSDAAVDASDGGAYVDGCFVGTPVTMSDFLNRCGGAVAFPARPARGTRLTPDGGVQPLPM